VKRHLTATVVGTAVGTVVPFGLFVANQTENGWPLFVAVLGICVAPGLITGLLAARKHRRSSLFVGLASAVVAFASPWIVYTAILVVAGATGNLE
jgi:hypothetical protein